MELYLTMMYVTLEQELAIKNLFLSRGWLFSKPVMIGTTDTLGPIAGLEKPATEPTSHSVRRTQQTTDQRCQMSLAKYFDCQTLNTGPSYKADNIRSQNRCINFNKKTDSKRCTNISGKNGLINNFEKSQPVDMVIPVCKREAEDNLMLSYNKDKEICTRETDCNKKMFAEKMIIKTEPQTSPTDTSGKQFNWTAGGDEVDLSVYVETDLIDARSTDKGSSYHVEEGERGNISSKDDPRDLFYDRDSGLEMGQNTPCKKKLKDSPIQVLCCQICGKAFRSKYGLTRHIREHTGDLFKCPICNKGYKERYLLTDHLATHAGSGVTKHRCGECSKLFTNRSNFVKHLRIHLKYSDSRLECPVCCKLFHNKERLAVHVQSYHRISDSP